MTILITGGSGKTATRLVTLLTQEHHHVLHTSRSGTNKHGIPAVKFDWTDADTFENPFQSLEAQKSPIHAVYLVLASGISNQYEVMKPFIDIAKRHGVKRFVLLSSAGQDETGTGTGKVHAYLKSLDVEWAVLRPVWFMELFSEVQYLPMIRDESKICSATGSGKIPFISAVDIAASAAALLTMATPPNNDYLIRGPKAISFDDVAAMLSEVLGRTVSHAKVSEEDVVQMYQKIGKPEVYARPLAHNEILAARGLMAQENDIVEQLTGRRPIDMRSFIESNKAVWIK